MFHWNHRIVRVKDGDETVLMFAEVHYNEDGGLMVYTEPFIHGETLDEMRQTAERLLKATSQPVLDENDFPKEI
jgi:hypothetical protein